jgi:hypothetical protein
MLIRKIEVKIRYIIWAFEESFKANSNYYAKYNGNMYYLKNEIYSENIWSLISIKDTNVKLQYINIKDFKVIIPSIGCFIRTFKSKMFFQNSSWFAIDIRKPIGNRISYNNSNNIKFN